MLFRSALAEPLSAPPLIAAPAYDPIRPLLARFRPIGLGQLDRVALQNRTDTKYVLSIAQLTRALEALASHYRVLEIGGRRMSAYQTTYFDTADFALYLQHHAGKSNRYKVRSRRYVDTGAAFLEFKLKTNKDRTVKQRVPTAPTVGSAELETFLSAYLPGDAPELRPMLGNTFSRITLASRSERERVTIDLNLRFSGAGQRVSLPGLAVVEIKQDGVDRCSGFIQQLQAAHLQPTGFSKYCIGVSLLYQQVKHNRFKPKLRLIDKLMGEPRYEH
jgi:hypothetical protein